MIEDNFMYSWFFVLSLRENCISIYDSISKIMSCVILNHFLFLRHVFRSFFTEIIKSYVMIKLTYLSARFFL